MEISYEDASAIRPGRYMLIDGRPVEVVSIDKSAPGKHGHAKLRITGVDLLTGSKKMGIWTSHDKVEVPIIEKKNAQVLNVVGDKVQLMDLETYENFEADIPEEFKGKIQPDMQVMYWLILDQKIIKQVRSG
jgi:translation initiation factor 5A